MVKKTKTVKDKIKEIELAHLATENYLEYAVASIGRMIPSSIDGLKPVQRRILYTMYVNKIFSFDKCLSIVGHTAQYITTGDTSVYAALVVLAQEGRYRYNTIVPQGNFGYVNSSSLTTYAASRYTEAKLSEYAKDFYFTEDLMYTQMSTTYKGGVEPTILPTLLPMGLVQGSNGIATGYSNYCLPHNLKDIAKCYIKFLDEIERNFSLKKMEEYIANNIRIDIPISKATLIRKSPRGLLDGIGQVLYKGRIKIEESSYGRKTIVITDLPYLVQPVKVLDDIKEALNKNESVKELISSIGDESSKDGIRVVIEVKKSATDKIQAIIDMLEHKTAFVSKYNYSFYYTNEQFVPSRMGIIDIFTQHYVFKKHVLEKYFNANIKDLTFKEKYLSQAVTILGNKDSRDKFIDMVSKSKPDTITAKLKKEFNIDNPTIDYLLNKRISSLINGVETIKNELKTVSLSLKDFKYKLKYPNLYMKERIEETIRKYK